MAVNPTIKSLGYGTNISQHLTDEVALSTVGHGGCHDVLCLDVYTSSGKAIGVYEAAGFVQVVPELIPDARDGGKLYIVMGKRVAVATT